MNKPRRRQWALISHGAGAGKSTFLASNARPPLLVVDTDQRFDSVEPLALGPVLYPTQVLDTLDLAEELILRVPKEGVKSLAWDSLTKLYSLPARLGFMRNLAGKQRISSSKASEMIDKSNAMTMARDLVVLGTDVYYCWHTTSGRDGLGQAEIRDMISEVEKGRLMTSVNISLEFFLEKGRFGVRVLEARNFGDRKANTDFVIYDEPGNYWRGGADLIEELIYTPFVSKDGAVKWASEQLGMTQEEAEAEYEHLKETERFASSGQAFAGWYLHIKGLKSDREARKVMDKTGAPPIPTLTQTPTPAPAPALTPESPAPESTPETGPKSDSIAYARGALEEIGDQVSIGNVVFGAATAWPDKFTADQALLKLRDYPELPEGVEIRMDRLILGATGLKMFDWLGEVELE